MEEDNRESEKRSDEAEKFVTHTPNENEDEGKPKSESLPEGEKEPESSPYTKSEDSEEKSKEEILISSFFS